jgi:predicted nucleic acid-binding protein
VKVLVDSSALLALLAPEDRHHEAARTWLTESHRRREDRLLSHNYVVLESAALIRSRLGAPATRALFDDLLPLVETVFVDESLHRAAVSSYLARPSGPSLVDRVSFHVMRDAGIRRAFAFDSDFRGEGFETVP